MHVPAGRHGAHITTRRGFVTVAGFGVVALYLLWVAYGAAPLPFAAQDDGHDAQASPQAGGHAGHGGAPAGPSAEDFRRLTEAFVDANRIADGSVRPGSAPAHDMAQHAGLAMAAAPAQDAGAPGAGHQGHAAHAQDAAQHAGHAMAAPAAGAAGAGHPGHGHAPAGSNPTAEAVDVYLMAFQWGYLPSVLRLEADTTYRFHMMAVDAAHGASFQLGRGGHIVRLRPQAMQEREITFMQPGEYLIYCTVYCGIAHDRMQAKVIVEAADRAGVAHGARPAH